MIAVIGTSTGGISIFKPGASIQTETLNAVRTYTGIPGYGATQYRVRCRSTSVAAAAGRYQLFLRYPKAVR
jgi:hypothetical protein